MREFLARTALLLGNFVVGMSILAPTGMMSGMATDLGASIFEVGLLMSCGAAAVCFGAPLMAWITSRADRRALLMGMIGVLALGNILSSVAPSYSMLFGLRMLMMFAAALYTPQAANAVSLFTDLKARSSAIAYVFLGWPLAFAAGLPALTLLATGFGWRRAYLLLGIFSMFCAVLLWMIPGKLRGTPISRQVWSDVFRSRSLLPLLVVTLLCNASQYVIFPYLSMLVPKFTGAGTATVSALFSIYGVTGLLGNLIAVRLVGVTGPLLARTIFLVAMMIGTPFWIFGVPALGALAAAVALWGLGFAAANTMQQAQLVRVAPSLAAASVALNTSAIYLGQALGALVGAELFANGSGESIGYGVAAFLLAALLITELPRLELARGNAKLRS